MQITRTFTQDKITPGTVRFQEDEQEGQPVAIGTVYVKKSVLGGQQPQNITVTIDVG